MSNNFISNSSITLKEALTKINFNKKGFLVIVNENNNLLGTITDGDIRRALIGGNGLNTKINKIINKKCIKLSVTNHIEDAIEIFKNKSVSFLPIVNENNELVNILTKKQLHSLLLLDKHVDMLFDFTQLDENIVDYEVFKRPWGYYKTTVLNDYFQAKIISIKPGGQLSLQSHNRREEHWIVVHGTGRVQLDDSFLYVICGSSIFIPKGCKHRVINTDNQTNLIIAEVQIGDYLGEDDIIRYEDIYGRK